MRLQRPLALGGRRFRPTLITVNLALITVLGVTAAYWALALTAPATAIAPAATAIAESNDSSLAQTIFGVEAGSRSAVPAASRLNDMKVMGIVTDRGRPMAVLSLDGKTSRAYGIGDEVAPGLRISAIDAQRVTFSPGGPGFELPAPERPASAMGNTSPRPPVGGTGGR